jgi:hypothetical protein
MLKFKIPRYDLDSPSEIRNGEMRNGEIRVPVERLFEGQYGQPKRGSETLKVGAKQKPDHVGVRVQLDSRAWQMAKGFFGQMSVPNSIYETVVHPNGTVRRKVRRDAVRTAARLTSSGPTKAKSD